MKCSPHEVFCKASHFIASNPLQALLPEASSNPGLRLPRTLSLMTGSGTNMTTVSLSVHRFTMYTLGRKVGHIFGLTQI